MQPLADSIRPKNLKEYVGQKHLVGPGRPLRVAIERGHLFSYILWGPPGVGKTTLARIYVNVVGGRLFELSAVSAGKEDIKKIVKLQQEAGRPKVLFLDEIHRFNKAQQDYLLPFVETGELILIGATTENPSFEIINPLLSRCRVFVLNELEPNEMREIISRTGVEMDESAIEWLISMGNGDARQVLSMVESAKELYGNVTVELLKKTYASKHLRYDKRGEEHYNTISAFIKSLRAGQPDAAIYYLARMIDAGEDPKFIARRMIVFASEDIGLAQPTALVVANEVFRSVEIVGLPEAAINLAHGTAFLCNAKKDRSSYNALMQAMEDVKAYQNLPIPLNLRNAPTKLLKELGYGERYKKYSKENFLPEKLRHRKYFL